MASCLRELWLVVSSFGFELRAVHLRGEENRLADWLSRWDLHPDYSKQFLQSIEGESQVYRELKVTNDYFQFSGDL